MRLVIRDHQRRHHVITRRLRLGFREARAAAVQSGSLQCLSPKRRGIFFLFLPKPVPESVLRDWRKEPMGRPLSFSCNSVGDYSAIANGIDILKLVRSCWSTRTFPCSNSTPLPCKNAVFGRMPTAIIVISLGKEHAFGLYSCHAAAACEAESFGVGQHTNPFCVKCF